MYISRSHKTKRIQNLNSLFEDLGIEHFSPRETFRLNNPEWVDKIGADEVFPPPKMLHENMKNTILLADRIREEWGSPVICLSGFRPYLYNEIVGGAESSMHQFYRALDLQPANDEIGDFIKLVENIVEEKREEEGQIIGFGKYKSFIHADTGHYKYNRDWDNR